MIVEAWLWDCGIWADRTGRYTSPRVFSALRAIAMSGLVKIKGLRYVPSSFIDRLPHEPDKAYKHRIAKTAETRFARVSEAATFLGYDFKDDTDITNILLPTRQEDRRLFFVMMPASKNRVCLIEKLLGLDPAARIVVVPPAFTNAKELKALKKIDNRSRIIPFLPYRYSAGMQFLHQIEAENQLIASVLNVISGPYPGRSSSAFRSFLNEFCLPALDCLIDGPIERGTLIYKETEAGKLPVILCDLIHATGRMSSVVLSATGNFQEVNFGLKVLFNGVTLDLTEAFQQIMLRGGRTRGNEFTESGHDPAGIELNGYKKLLSNITIGGDVPKLDTFLNTQLLVDRIFEALDKLPAAERGHPQQTQI